MSYDAIVKKLRKIRSRIYRYFLIDGINRVIILGSILTTLILLENAFLNVPPVGLGVTIAIAAFIILLYFIRFIMYPLSRRLSIEDIALIVEQEYPLFKDSLISTIQFEKSKDYADRSGELSEQVIADTIRTAQEIDFRDVIKPQKLNVTGFFAVAFSLVLTATVYFTMTMPRSTGIAFTLDFPDNITKYNINYYKTTSDDIKYRENFTIGEGSDIVIRAVPKAYKYDREFDILDYDVPEIHFRNTKNNVVKNFRMSQGYDDKGRKVYEYVENKISLGTWEVNVTWEKRNSLKYLFNVRPAPTIMESEIRYKAPEHMRPSEILIVPETVDTEAVKVQIDTLSSLGYTITLPKRDKNGEIIFDKSGRPEMTDIRRFKDDAEFEKAFPKIYEKYVRGTTEKWSDTINEIESTEVSMKLKLNKELNLKKSFLRIFYKQEAGKSNQSKTINLRKMGNADGEGTVYYQTDFILDLNMVKYQFYLEDTEHLRQNEDKSYVINVQSDQRPFARFVYTGSSLRERSSSDRLVTPTGFIPMIIEAKDDFGINGVRLLYTINGMTKKQRELFDAEHAKKQNEINACIKNLSEQGEARIKATQDLLEFDELALKDVSQAIEDTKNGDLRDLLKRIKEKIMLKPVQDFNESVIITDQPTNPPNINFTVQVEKLLSEEVLSSITDDTSMSITFIVEVEDNRKSLVKDLINGKIADVNRGQTFRSEPLTVSLVTLRTLQREIRTIMRKTIKIKLTELIFKQIALLKATDLFHKDPTALRLDKKTKRGGIAYTTIFEDEVMRKDAEGDEVRYDGQAIGRMQDEISRIADGLVYRLDSIVRHYKNNLDLEKGDANSPQQNTVQRIKILLNLISLDKEIAYEVNPELKRLENDQTRINQILRLMLNDTTGLETVLPSFDTIDFAQTLVSMEITQASISREAALTYEEIISPDNIDNFERVRVLLKNENELQTKNLDVLEECSELMKIWDEFEEHKHELQRILEQQERLIEPLKDLSE